MTCLICDFDSVLWEKGGGRLGKFLLLFCFVFILLISISLGPPFSAPFYGRGCFLVAIQSSAIGRSRAFFYSLSMDMFSSLRTGMVQ